MQDTMEHGPQSVLPEGGRDGIEGQYIGETKFETIDRLIVDGGMCLVHD
jgi:hypothetical protein